jgi:hypothetical protein
VDCAKLEQKNYGSIVPFFFFWVMSISGHTTWFKFLPHKYYYRFICTEATANPAKLLFLTENSKGGPCCTEFQLNGKEPLYKDSWGAVAPERTNKQKTNTNYLYISIRVRKAEEISGFILVD